MLADEFSKARIKNKLFTQSIMKPQVSDGTVRIRQLNKRINKNSYIIIQLYKLLETI
jgi:hypothetical protein